MPTGEAEYTYYINRKLLADALSAATKDDIVKLTFYGEDRTMSVQGEDTYALIMPVRASPKKSWYVPFTNPNPVEEA